MKSKDLQTRLPYPERLSFKIEGEIKSFPDKKKLKELVNIATIVTGLEGEGRRRRTTTTTTRRRRRRRRNTGK